MTLPSLSTWRRRVAGMRGWRRRGLAAGLGALACLALPPAHVLPVLVPAFTGLVWLLDGATDRRAAFGAGWWFGFGYFSLGFYWIGAAMLVEAEKFAWMIPFAVFGVAGVEALFTGLAGLAAWMAVRALGVLGGGAPTGPARVLLLAAAWGAGEWLRSWAFTGFPWNPVGAVWVVSDAMAQVAALVGVYGLGMVTVAAAAMPAVLGDGGAGRRSWGPVAVMAGLLVLAWGGGALRLAGATDATVPGVRLRLVQPDIPQRLKWQADLRAGHIRRQVDMSLAPPADGDPAPTHVIWGETMVPAFLDRDESARALVAQAVPPGGLVLAGAPRAPDTGGPFRVWNSLLAVDGAGRVVATYDKAHLVPFGEYVPFRSILPIDKITAGRGDFSAGPGPRAVDLPGLPPVGPQICYEIIFPGRVVGDRRPAWLLNITNDSWFGRTAGPY
ncbi:MAG: apolipoprotein N-acyltransferase, partial [Rhodobacterales bacterium]|nr:apolipoprotein N-acyltransferase [Rhodobacterales bacterium]